MTEKILPDLRIKARVDIVLNKMSWFFHTIEPSLVHPISRQQYFEKHPELDDDKKWNFPFSLSADDIINKKIPWQAAGCTGCAKLFSKYAREIGLDDFMVVLTVKREHVEQYAQGQLRGQIAGHQAIAIRLSDGLHIIDVQHGLGKTFEEIEVKSDCKIDANIDFEHHRGYIIAALLSPTEYDNMDSYDKLKDLYLGCNSAKTILKNNATKKIQQQFVVNQLSQNTNQSEN